MDAEKEKRRLNRLMVANKRNIEGYIKVEEAVRLTPISEPLPSWITTDNLPYLLLSSLSNSKRDYDDDFTPLDSLNQPD